MASVLKASTFALSANTTASTTLTQIWGTVEVVNSSTTDVVYARGDGTNATVAGDNCEVVLPGERLTIPVKWDFTTNTGVVTAISSGTPTVTVVGAF